MKRRRISRGDDISVVVVIVTLDHHVAGALDRATARLRAEVPGLEVCLHAASDFDDRSSLARCHADIARGDIVVANMLFVDEHIRAVLPALQARREHCDAMVCTMSAGEVMRLTRMGSFRMDGSRKGLALLKKLRGVAKSARGPSRPAKVSEAADRSAGAGRSSSSGRGSHSGRKGPGAAQLKMLRRLPKLLALVPGKTAADLRAYVSVLGYWLAGSTDNLADMLRMLVGRYADGPRRGLRGTLRAAPPREYPEVGVYHPRLPGRISEELGALSELRGASLRGAGRLSKGTVGLLVMRSYVLAGDAGHYDAVIAGLEARGLDVLPVFASGLDATPAVERFFLDETGAPRIDALVSLTGFSLVGGPAFHDAAAAEVLLTRLDVPYLGVQPLEFQSVDRWRGSTTGLSPLESTLMVAIPELDGATGPMVFGGRDASNGAASSGVSSSGVSSSGVSSSGVSSSGVSSSGASSHSGPDGLSSKSAAPMVGIADRVALLARRVERLVTLRRTPPAERQVGIVLFDFPPNGGATGTAAYLSVFASLHGLLGAMKAEGYDVEVPESVDALRAAILEGNAERFGTDANVVAQISAEDHVRHAPHLAEIEAQWGPAPGRALTDGRSLFVLGARFGKVLVGVQPAFGYEGDPMRLLFEGNFAPTHAFDAFYRYLREGFGAHALLHFGTHGALEFMPGKQVGLSARCWPERLIDDVPNVYLYAANNPSEGALAKRRAAATLVSYRTPPLAQAGLYKELASLREGLDHYRRLPPGHPSGPRLLESLRAQVGNLELQVRTPHGEPSGRAEQGASWQGAAKRSADERWIASVVAALTELEQTLIPSGLHVLGAPMAPGALLDTLTAIDAEVKPPLPSSLLAELAKGIRPDASSLSPETLVRLERLQEIAAHLREDGEIPGVLRALGGRFVRPAPGGDLLRNPEVLPTGRNLHGFDPFALPTAFACEEGARQAELLLARHREAGHRHPRSVAMVLWGADNLKSGGGPIAQALALLGARPRFDAYGRLAGAQLIALEELGRPRVDVMMTLSGIFRDLLPLQTRLLAEAAWLAAQADEPASENPIRANALAYQARHGCDLETAALRVFSNAEGAYGANVNQLVESGLREDEDELTETYTRRKCFAYGVSGVSTKQPELLGSVLESIDLAYQNLESLELGVTTIDHYFDTLGGIGRAARRAKGAEDALPVYIGDATRAQGTVRTLSEQVDLESRTRSLNPKWAEAMLSHGAEGVRQLEAQVTNTLGWSATVGAVPEWVYRELTETYVLDEAMRQRLAELNPKASMKLASRLLEASDRRYWAPDESTLAALEAAGDELEDQLEGLARGRDEASRERGETAPRVA